MANFENFFGEQNPEEVNDQAILPEIAITEPLGNILPNTVLYPQTVQYSGVYAVDTSTNLLFINTLAEVGHSERNPDKLRGNVLPLIRILTIIENEDESELIDGFIVDGRNNTQLSSVQKIDVVEENERAENYPEYLSSIPNNKLYVPALAVVFETPDKKLAINGDQRLKKFGFGLILAVNKTMIQTAKPYDTEPTGTYAITQEYILESGDSGQNTETEETTPETKEVKKRKFFR